MVNLSWLVEGVVSVRVQKPPAIAPHPDRRGRVGRVFLDSPHPSGRGGHIEAPGPLAFANFNIVI